MFITFEGIEGSGKSTQLRQLEAALRARGRELVVTKEPGGTPLADRIRELLLDSSSVIDPVAEVLLFAASRRQHVFEVIRPALERGAVVLCDRFTDSTLAYQGFGRLIDLDRLRELNAWATGGLVPDLVIIFDLPEQTGLSRARQRNSGSVQDEGRFEAEDLRFHRRIREGYLALAVAEPKRYAVLESSGGVEDVHARLVALLSERAPGLLA